MQRARELKYLSHTARTCGLHVHINRAALGESVEEQENAIGRIVFFFEKFWDNILRFSRRTEGQANRWAARYCCSVANPKESLKDAKNSCLGRYTAVNLINLFTVELRIFRGTLRYETFAATLQFVDRLCHAAIEMSDEDFQTMTWNDFAASVKDMPELTEYLKIRGLYGVLSYGHEIKDISEITEALAVESAVRGTDATGIAYNYHDIQIIYSKNNLNCTTAKQWYFFVKKYK